MRSGRREVATGRGSMMRMWAAGLPVVVGLSLLAAAGVSAKVPVVGLCTGSAPKGVCDRYTHSFTNADSQDFVVRSATPFDATHLTFLTYQYKHHGWGSPVIDRKIPVNPKSTATWAPAAKWLLVALGPGEFKIVIKDGSHALGSWTYTAPSGDPDV
jgi:hypothetical protein